MRYSSGARFSRAKPMGSFRVFHPNSRRVAAHAETLREARADAAFWGKQTPTPIEIQERFPSGEWVTVETVKRTGIGPRFAPTGATRSKRSHATVKTEASSPNDFWDLYEEELTKSVAKDPSDYALQRDESPEGYARKVRQSFQRTAEDKGLRMINLDSHTFKRLARRLGIAKFSQRALKDAYAARGGKP